MKKEIKSSITINANKEKIWNILCDFKAYPNWNPFITSVSGALSLGGILKVKIQGMQFSPEIIALQEFSELKWFGHLWVKGIFDGEHQFLLVENQDGSVQFHQNEKFSGLLVRLFSKSINQNTTTGFINMNEALKARAEKTQIS